MIKQHVCLSSLVLISIFSQSLVADVALEARVADILAKTCGMCHRDSDEGGINYITNLTKLVERKKVVAGTPAASRIMIRITDTSDPMPPVGESPRPTEKEIQTIRAWIDSLAEPITTVQPPRPTSSRETEEADRQPVSTVDVISAVHQYISSIDEQDRRFQRFFVLNHLHNLPSRKLDKDRGYDREQLDVVRAAVSKTVNSLTWVPDVVVPKVIDANKTVMAIDLRDVQWNENRSTGQPDLWNILLEEYPYALMHDQYPDVSTSQRKAREIYDMTGVNFPWIRADWFVATATQPHFYHALLYDAFIPAVRLRKPREITHADGKARLEQPMTTDDLFQLLNVDLLGNMRRGRVARAGFTRSGVSSQPRLLERTSAIYGYLWGSYDFKRGNQTMNLNARPLGPDGALDSRFAKFSFQHDGGEMIFGLPNGLQGYLLVNAAGDRIAFGPPDIVEDRAKTLGNGIIVNGLSCMACHKQGLIEDFRDEVRFGIKGLPAEARQVARKLYLDRPELDVFIDQDQSRYRQSLLRAVGPFVSAASLNAMESGGALIEPIGPVARRFLVDTIDLTMMAHELEVPPETLEKAVEFNEGLQRLGLTGLSDGGTTNREIWQSGSGLTAFQRAAQILKVGTPGSFQAPPWRNR